MTELLWQSTLLLALAFFFGAVFACGLKRRYWYARTSKQAAARGGFGRFASAGAGPAEDRGGAARRSGRRAVRPRDQRTVAPDGTRSDFDGVIRGGSDGCADCRAAQAGARTRGRRCARTDGPGACRPSTGAAHFQHLGDDGFGRPGESRRRRGRAER